jgi:hypothetical protein
MDDLQSELLELGLNRPLAHRVLFSHRHVDRHGNAQASAPFHDAMADDWSSEEQYLLDMVFRGGAKSTIGEESCVLGGLYVDFRYCLIVGASQPKAAERLAAIRHEFRTNEKIQALFGEDATLEVDTATEIITSRGVKFQALGRGQSLRGLKHRDQRPDFIWIDDLEDREDVSKPERRKAIWDWLTRDLLPACDPEGRVRMSATPLHPECVPERLVRDKAWKVRRIPIYYKALDELDSEGLPKLYASWPARFSLKKCLNMEQAYRARGELENFKQEYMCQAEEPSAKPFQLEMIKIFPQVKSWQMAQSMTDPARSVKRGSATTGKAIWSWIDDKLVIWDGWAKKLMPNEIVASLFDDHDRYATVWDGVEEDGLNEFLMQPIRQEMVRRGNAIPVKAVKAPVGKLDFIRGLQPFFHAREVQFAKPLPELQEQLLGFPTGDIDAPNALAYALRLRPGIKLYEDFGPRNIVEDLRPAGGRTIYLAFNATKASVTAVAVQSIDGALRVFGDLVREGDPGAVVADMLAAFQLEFGRPDLKPVCGPQHWDRYNNVGLVQAFKAIPREVKNGQDLVKGKAVIRRGLQRERHGMPMLLVSDQATWTLNAFVGGYCRQRVKAGELSEHPEDGPYRVLMEGLENFAGVLDLGDDVDSSDDGRHYAHTSDGRRYVSMIGQRGR